MNVPSESPFRFALAACVALVCASGLAAQVGTTVLNFDDGASVADPEYGSLVASSPQATNAGNSFSYGGISPYTPDVAVAIETEVSALYAGATPNRNVNWWGLGYADLQGVLYFDLDTTRARIALSSIRPGADVIFQSVAVGYYGGTDVPLRGMRLLDSSGGVLSELSAPVVPGRSRPALVWAPMGITPLTEVILEIDLPLDRNVARDYFAIDNLTFAQVQSGADVGQANRPEASLTVNGLGIEGLRGPFAVSLGAGGSLGFDWRGVPGSPLLLLADAGVSSSPIGLGGNGSYDLAGGPFSPTLEILFDGTSARFPDVLFVLDAGGRAAQSFSIPAALAGSSLGIQGLVWENAPIGMPRLTAAFELRL